MKRIFLTGSTGLLGREFLEEISKEEFEIILGTRKKNGTDEKFEHQYFNLEDSNSELNLTNIDIIVH